MGACKVYNVQPCIAGKRDSCHCFTHHYDYHSIPHAHPPPTTSPSTLTTCLRDLHSVAAHSEQPGLFQVTCCVLSDLLFGLSDLLNSE